MRKSVINEEEIVLLVECGAMRKRRGEELHLLVCKHTQTHILIGAVVLVRTTISTSHLVCMRTTGP